VADHARISGTAVAFHIALHLLCLDRSQPSILRHRALQTLVLEPLRGRGWPSYGAAAHHVWNLAAPQT
jgi:hypothetical protein